MLLHAVRRRTAQPFGYLEMRVDAENGATAGKFDLAKRAKALNLDAIHDTVHEMARDEARHNKKCPGPMDRGTPYLTD